MLTVIRELAEEAERRRHRATTRAARGARPARRRGGRAHAASSCRCCARRASSTRARRAWSRSCAASRRRVTGEPLPEAPPSRRRSSALDAIHQELSRYRYCTVFVSRATSSTRDALEAELEQLGDSLLVVGDRDGAQGARAHRRPRPRALARRRARRRSTASRSRTCTSRRVQREERLLARRARCAARADRASSPSSSGDGQPRAVREPRRDAVVDGGQTMNPSTADLVAAIEATDARRGGRAAEQQERDPGRRAGGRARVEAGARRADATRCRPGSRRWSRSIPSARADENAADDGRGARRASRPARSRSRRATSS